MKRLILAALPLALAACAGGQPVDVCKGAALRRTAYLSTIAAADAYAAAGRPVPPEVETARQTAVILLAVLDGNCPLIPPGE